MGIPYNATMDRVRELVATKAREKGKTLADLSRAIGRNHAYLQQFVKRGVPTELPEKVRPKLAKLLDIQEALLRADFVHFAGHGSPEPYLDPEAPDDRPGTPTVKLVGYVAAGNGGATAFFYPGDLDDVPAPVGANSETVAVEVRGNSLGELFDRWLIFYDDVRRPVTSDLIGRLCVVGLADGRVLVKKIRKNKDLFDLHSNLPDEEPIRGVAIDWAARVKLMVPR